LEQFFRRLGSAAALLGAGIFAWLFAFAFGLCALFFRLAGFGYGRALTAALIALGLGAGLAIASRLAYARKS